MRTVGIVLHPTRPEAVAVAERAVHWLEDRGAIVRVPKLEGLPHSLADRACDTQHFVDDIDFAVSIGGDGTMLRTVELVAGAGVAVLGVNAGHLGYLTQVEPDQMEPALERVLRGDYLVDERMLLALTVESPGPCGGTWLALNEAVLEKTRGSHLVGLGLEINDRQFTTYLADAVIVATPTGSTAYSFSARGPIASPRLRCILLTPVSPHMLFDRTLVLDASESARFTVQDGRAVELTIDGRHVGELGERDTVTCTGAGRPAKLIVLDPRDFHQVVKAKFGLADR
jgi:NAD+ kinase